MMSPWHVCVVGLGFLPIPLYTFSSNYNFLCSMFSVVLWLTVGTDADVRLVPESLTH